MKELIQWGGTYRILIVDDEPDIHAVTKLSLKALSRKFGPVEFLSAYSGRETLKVLEQYPDIAVILLDVVMESDTAGLDVCAAIRNEISNPLVRILLRTGQPGVAPEQQTIDTYDIDGYLAKTETSSARLYTAVRCALKAYRELLTLERHRTYLSAVHDCAVALNADLRVEHMLGLISETALSICPAPLVALELETFEHTFAPRHISFNLTAEGDTRANALAVETARARVQKALAASRVKGPILLDDGFLVPIVLHRELGHGWIFLDGFAPDELSRKILTLLASHAQNAIYAAVALGVSRQRKAYVFEEASI